MTTDSKRREMVDALVLIIESGGQNVSDRGFRAIVAAALLELLQMGWLQGS